MTADVRKQVCEDIYKMIIYTNEKLCRPFEDSFKERLSTLQLNALCLLGSYGDQSMKQLSQHLSVTKQQLTKTVARLVEMGFVSQQKANDDRRRVYVRLTPYGKNYLSARNHDYISRLCSEIESKVDTYDFDRFSTAVVTINDIFEEISGGK